MNKHNKRRKEEDLIIFHIVIGIREAYCGENHGGEG